LGNENDGLIGSVICHQEASRSREWAGTNLAISPKAVSDLPVLQYDVGQWVCVLELGECSLACRPVLTCRCACQPLTRTQLQMQLQLLKQDLKAYAKLYASPNPFLLNKICFSPSSNFSNRIQKQDLKASERSRGSSWSYDMISKCVLNCKV
jgi:hypothetical protein